MKRPSPIKDQIIALHKAGWSNNEICISMGKDPGNVSNALSEARRAGLLPNYQPRNPNTMTSSVYKHVAQIAKDSGRGVGSFQAVLGSLPYSISKWLIAETPPGSDLSLTIAAIITDAYFEENSHE